jgi:hypothetical protein
MPVTNTWYAQWTRVNAGDGGGPKRVLGVGRRGVGEKILRFWQKLPLNCDSMGVPS